MKVQHDIEKSVYNFQNVTYKQMMSLLKKLQLIYITNSHIIYLYDKLYKWWRLDIKYDTIFILLGLQILYKIFT